MSILKALSLLLTVTLSSSLLAKQSEHPRVFIFTDINIDQGDPDDRQSLIHLLWYADELQIEGIVPDRWSAQGLEACNLVIDAYAKDYATLKAADYPTPESLRKRVAVDKPDAMEMFQQAASDDSSPLYVLVWGNMDVFKDALLQQPDLAKNIRLITIGTGLMLEDNIPHMPASWEKSPPCQQLNWNGKGRNIVYEDEQFNDMWWLEINWTYEGMFSGEEPKEMFEALSAYGALGQHMQEVVKNQEWARYFRVGDTPSVLYVIDATHNLDDPTQSSWAGKFVKPLPETRPNYYTDFSGSVAWDYADPCTTWANHREVRDVAASTLEKERPDMYQALLDKLDEIYGK
ncbi:MAG: nucleoside hydrolase-like domain-containing protein [Bacteroidota bacterium]